MAIHYTHSFRNCNIFAHIRTIPRIWRDLTMAYKLMYIPNYDKQNYPFCSLKLVVKICKHSTWWNNQSKFTKDPKPTNKKALLKKTLGTSLINFGLFILFLNVLKLRFDCYLQNYVKEDEESRLIWLHKSEGLSISFLSVFFLTPPFLIPHFYDVRTFFEQLSSSALYKCHLSSKGLILLLVIWGIISLKSNV